MVHELQDSYRYKKNSWTLIDKCQVMTPVISFGIFLLLICTLGCCFTHAEVEIFQLQQELVKKYGADINFYKFLKLPKLQDSTAKEVTKNLRKLSKKYHPDKNKKFKKLYGRLNIASNILSNYDTRKTYDYYLKHGFPDYDFRRGGFFFKRVQPKTWFLVLFVSIASSLIHYVLLKTQAHSQRKRVQFFIDQAKSQDDTHGLGEKKLLFQQHSEDEPRQIIIRYGDVFICENENSETLISPDTVPEPGVLDTLFFRLPLAIVKPLVRPFLNSEKKDKSQESSANVQGNSSKASGDKSQESSANLKGNSSKASGVKPRKVLSNRTASALRKKK